MSPALGALSRPKRQPPRLLGPAQGGIGLLAWKEWAVGPSWSSLGFRAFGLLYNRAADLLHAGWRSLPSTWDISEEVLEDVPKC